jgi:hypothetical protein
MGSGVNMQFLHCLLVLAFVSASPALAAIPHADAERAVADVRLALARDGGKLWGVSLEGPILFVEAATRQAVATDPDSAGVLRADGTLYIGVLPSAINVANTSLRWNGRLWSMVVWPLPADSLRARALLIHELWHRVQGGLGLPASGPSNPHLDSQEGRLWLELEWRALARALAQPAAARQKAIADALSFRAVRRKKFPGSAASESALERHEGLAEYTGVRLATRSAAGAAAMARAAIDDAATLGTFVRSFAYVSGPAYGLLLDDARPGWRRELGGGADLGDLLRTALRLPPPDSSASAARARAVPYGLDSLRTAEAARERRRLQRMKELRARFADGPTLRIPLTSPKLSFDPLGVQPLDSLGTLYGGLRITDRWGVLDAPEGGLIAPDWSTVTVPAPGATVRDTLRGPGWTLALRPEWELEEGATPGSLKLATKR